jgi:hypothetical protein
VHLAQKRLEIFRALPMPDLEQTMAGGQVHAAEYGARRSRRSGAPVPARPAQTTWRAAAERGANRSHPPPA